MSIGAHRDGDLSGPLILHLVEGVLAEVELMIKQHANAEAELTRLNTKVTALEAEIAQLRNRRSPAAGQSPHSRLERLFHHWTSFRAGVRS
jgi:hypothetical protein